MIDPTISCPHCRSEIKLTESLAAPLLAATRERYEARLAQKEKEVGDREAAIRRQEGEITKAKAEIGQEVTARLEKERKRVAAEEAEKAKRLVALDLDEKSRQLNELGEVLKQRDAKLAEAQKA